MSATWWCWYVDMTASPVRRRLPPTVTVVDVDGSRFLLEWLDLGTLAAAAAAGGGAVPMSSVGTVGLPWHGA
jgi:hypothetical protein